MNIIEGFLTINPYSRPGRSIVMLKALVLHWTANPMANAKQNRDFFESRKTGMGGYGSAHYVIGQKGEIIHCIPDDEIAYHCGSSQTDPASGKIYTDYARQKFGWFAKNPDKTSPNWITLGIELCPVDIEGTFTADTIQSAAELAAILLKQNNLQIDALCTHNQIVGWKDCPRLWVNNPEKYTQFKQMVKEMI